MMGRALRLSAPRQPLSPATRSMLPGAPLASLMPGLETRNGFSLACNGCPFQSLHSRVNAPNLLLRFPASRFRRPFGCSAPRPLPVCPGKVRFSASCPLRLPLPPGPASPPASTPLRDFYLPPDQSVLQDSLPVCPPSDSARSPFAPRRQFSIARCWAADHRSRSATFSEACCSSNLLEPSSICACRHQSSTVFVPEQPLFLKFFLPCFHQVTFR